MFPLFEPAAERCAFKGLYLALLVDAQHQRPIGRRQTIFQNATVPRPSATIDLSGGGKSVSGTGFSKRCESWSLVLRASPPCIGLAGRFPEAAAIVDADGNPIAIKLSEGQADDGRSAADMLDSVGLGQILLADRAYDSDALRQNLANRGAWANIKPISNRVNVPAFSPYLYQFRNIVERFFSKLKHFRAVAARFEKHTLTTSHSSNWPQPEFGCDL
jgi:transposase